MRSRIVQRQIKNNISYEKDSPQRQNLNKIVGSVGRPQSANMAIRNNKYMNLSFQSALNNSEKLVNLGHSSQLRQKIPIIPKMQVEEDVNKVYSRALLWDKEKLIQEQSILKRNVNSLKDENLKLKTRIQQLEAAILKYEKIFTDYESVGPVKPQLIKYTNESQLTNALKKEINVLKKGATQREEEALKLKRSLKHTKIQQTEIEKRAYRDETIRLKYLLEQTLQASFLFMTENNVQQEIQEKLMLQSQQIQELKLQKIELDSVIFRLQKQCLYQRTSQIEVENKLGKEVKKLRLEIQEKSKELDQLKPMSKKKNDIQMSQKKNDFFKQQLKDRDIIIEELERKIRASPVVESVREQTDATPMQRNSNDRVIELTFQNSELMLPKNIEEEQPKEQSKSRFARIIEFMESSPANVRTTTMQPVVVRRPHPLQFHEVKSIGETVRYRLRALKINWSDIDQYIYSERSRESGFTTLGELRSYLIKFPFDLSLAQANLVARYSVETGMDTTLNEFSQQSTPIVKSVLRRVIGVYTTDMNVDSALRYRLEELLSRFKPFILQSIRAQVGVRGLYITKNQLEDCFTALGLELTSSDYDFLLVQCILESPDANQLNYIEMLKFIPDDLRSREVVTQQTENKASHHTESKENDQNQNQNKIVIEKEVWSDNYQSLQPNQFAVNQDTYIEQLGFQDDNQSNEYFAEQVTDREEQQQKQDIINEVFNSDVEDIEYVNYPQYQDYEVNDKYDKDEQYMDQEEEIEQIQYDKDKEQSVQSEELKQQYNLNSSIDRLEQQQQTLKKEQYMNQSQLKKKEQDYQYVNFNDQILDEQNEINDEQSNHQYEINNQQSYNQNENNDELSYHQNENNNEQSYNQNENNDELSFHQNENNDELSFHQSENNDELSYHQNENNNELSFHQNENNDEQSYNQNENNDEQSYHYNENNGSIQNNEGIQEQQYQTIIKEEQILECSNKEQKEKKNSSIYQSIGQELEYYQHEFLEQSQQLIKSEKNDQKQNESSNTHYQLLDESIEKEAVTYLSRRGVQDENYIYSESNLADLTPLNDMKQSQQSKQTVPGERNFEILSENQLNELLNQRDKQSVLIDNESDYDMKFGEDYE